MNIDTRTAHLLDLEHMRRRLAIRLVTVLAGAGLLLVLAAWALNR